jgi:hypothetical protein
MGLNCGLALLVPLNKLDAFYHCLQNFQELYATSTYFRDDYADVRFDEADQLVEKFQIAFSERTRENYSHKRMVGCHCSGKNAEIFFRFDADFNDFWSEKLGCFPVTVFADFSSRGVISLLRNQNRSIFYAILDIFPIFLGYPVVETSIHTSDRNSKSTYEWSRNEIFFDDILFLGDGAFNFFEDYFFEETDFFFKKKIASRKYLLASHSLFFRENNYESLINAAFEDEINQTDFLYRSSEKRLKEWEEERLKALGIPREIPDYKDWDSAKSSSK